MNNNRPPSRSEKLLGSSVQPWEMKTDFPTAWEAFQKKLGAVLTAYYHGTRSAYAAAVTEAAEALDALKHIPRP